MFSASRLVLSNYEEAGWWGVSTRGSSEQPARKPTKDKERARRTVLLQARATHARFDPRGGLSRRLTFESRAPFPCTVCGPRRKHSSSGSPCSIRMDAKKKHPSSNDWTRHESHGFEVKLETSGVAPRHDFSSAMRGRLAASTSTGWERGFCVSIRLT